ncbi:hypothetical protein FDJ28_gp56 [Pseudomonas phage Bjorn]|uniref:Uncharacterized protein n=1 Tax=Pseudomonas phage Bjorn TaxID=2079288 RepID=A0A2K9VHP7_9CAUD|nr:hypothetical protein FDJ28_gp56 [Pseudomonas phage Bjorn]AUV61802.1 hypothetical protein PsPhBjorn_gp14 [Pseudomonas phage Bjorn]
MKIQPYHHSLATIGFYLVDDGDHDIGDITPDRNGEWSLSIVAEAFHPAQYVGSNDLRNIALVIDHLNSGETP